MMEQDLGDEWVFVPREGDERSQGKLQKRSKERREEKGDRTWEELVAQEEMASEEADDGVLERCRWRKYV